MVAGTLLYFVRFHTEQHIETLAITQNSSLKSKVSKQCERNETHMTDISENKKSVISHSKVIIPVNEADYLKDYSKLAYKDIPICNKLAFYFVPGGGLGNQINCFTMLYIISTVEKIPIFIPEYSSFILQYTIKEHFPGQIQKYSWDDYLYYYDIARTKVKLRTSEYIINHNIDRNNKNEPLINKRNLCAFYGKDYRRLFFTGYGTLTDYLLKNPLYFNTLDELNIKRKDIYHPGPVSTYDSVFYILDTFLTPYKPIYDLMQKYFPNYKTDKFLSCHIRYGKLSDLHDTSKERMKGDTMGKIVNIISERLKASNLSYAYIASDSSKFKEYAKSILKEKAFVVELGKITHTDMKFNTDIQSLEENGAIALAELYLLSYGSDCIESPLSSFSFIACSRIQTNHLTLSLD
ncbi:hypothetical protein WA158_004437 [Blastocystis sp. Blastoise]